MMGGFPVNSDDRLWNAKDAPFVLTIFDRGSTMNFAVSDEDAGEIIERILKLCEGKPPRRYAPSPVPARDGPEATAVVQIGKDYLDFDDAALLHRWLDELREKSGDPLTDAQFYHYTHPAPAPVEGDVKVVSIVEQAVVPPQPPSLPVPPPDSCRSELLVDAGIAVLSVYQSGMHLEYLLPNELLPKVNEAAKAMLSHPADGYHQAWDAEARICIEGSKTEFDVEPEDVLQLFGSLVGECGDPIPVEGKQYYYKVSPDSVRRRLARSWVCPLCGKTRNTGKFCEICGAALEEIEAGAARSAPRARADAPWHCSACHVEGNIGQYCSNCGGTYTGPSASDSSKIGYRKGAAFSFGISGAFAMHAPQAIQPPAPASGAPDGSWTCFCGNRNTGKFCTECGRPRP